MRRSKYVFLIIGCCFSLFSNIKPKEVDDLKLQIQKEIDDQLAGLVLQKVKTKKEEKKTENKIKNKVSREVKTQCFNEVRNYSKDKVYGNVKKTAFYGLKDDPFIYKLPAWPFYSLFYTQKDIFQLALSFDFATQAYSSNGGTQDMSSLVFGDNKIEIQDVLLVSKLVKEYKLAASSKKRMNVGGTGRPANDNHYFSILADQLLNFDGSTEKQTANMNYARHFKQGDISFGFQVPFVRRENKLKLNSSISTSKQVDLRKATTTPKFYTKYSDLEAYFEDILKSKDLSFNTKDTEVGLGDIAAFLNFEFDWRHCERLVTGFHALFPTARSRNIYKLWDPELGNGGFTELSAFGAILFSQNRFLNPHFFAKASFGLPANVSRRVPKLVSYDGKNPVPGQKVDDRMAMGEYVYFAYAEVAPSREGVAFTDEPDSTVKRFADSAKKIKIRPGAQFMFRAGNIIERFLLNKAFLDIFYDIRIKGKDYLGFRLDSSEWDNAILKDDTFQTEQRIGLDLSYQFDDNFRFKLGSMYSFAGRNVPKTLNLNCALNIEF